MVTSGSGYIWNIFWGKSQPDLLWMWWKVWGKVKHHGHPSFGQITKWTVMALTELANNSNDCKEVKKNGGENKQSFTVHLG